MAKKLAPISEHLILQTLSDENPWWQTNEIDYDIDLMKRRLYFDLFFPLVEEVSIKRAVVLMGPRRVGKTVLMNHAIDKLLENKIPKDKICFINIENPLYSYKGLEELFGYARKSVNEITPDGWFVFFDEIQYLTNWEVHLKVIVDKYPKTKFIVSGSAATALRIRSNESGAGRFTDFMLPPLTFHEYIYMKDYDSLIKKEIIIWNGKPKTFLTGHNMDELNKHFIDYINFGGYPEVIFNEKIQQNPTRFIKKDIVDKVLLKDLPSHYGIQSVQELNAFFTHLIYYSGQEVSISSLSTNSGVKQDTLKRYLEYLEAAFLIKQIHRIDDNAKKFLRATKFKVYLTNPSLRSAVFAPLQADDELGHMVETAVYSQWIHREWMEPFYANWDGGEVDIVFLNRKNFKPHAAVEIKWSNKFVGNTKDLKSLIHFCKKNELKSVIVTTKDLTHTVESDGITFHYYPSASYALTVGYNTIVKKSNNN